MHKKLIFALFIPLFLSNCSLFVPGASKLNKKSLKKHAQYDVIIVPGFPFNEPQMEMQSLLRVIWSVHLYKRGIAKNIIYSGAAVYTPYVEAKIMKQYAVAMGVPEENVFIEYKAEHSTENIWYGFLLAKQKGFKTFAVASDIFQTKLLYRFARKRTKGVEFLPAIFDTLRTLSHEIPPIEYKSLKVEPFIPITERESKLKRWRGTQGKHINYKDTIY
ncbi:MAG: YdcF family protein [Bacteroidia bacterium]|nr:YdcF family protein [Bacteroidia bacterium]